jgi:hypothetical protein
MQTGSEYGTQASSIRITKMIVERKIRVLKMLTFLLFLTVKWTGFSMAFLLLFSLDIA